MIKDGSIINRYRGDAGAALLEKQSPKEIQSGGYAMPPFHPACRHSVIAVTSMLGHNIITPAPIPALPPTLD